MAQGYLSNINVYKKILLQQYTIELYTIITLQVIKILVIDCVYRVLYYVYTYHILYRMSLIESPSGRYFNSPRELVKQ